MAEEFFGAGAQDLIADPHQLTGLGSEAEIWDDTQHARRECTSEQNKHTTKRETYNRDDVLLFVVGCVVLLGEWNNMTWAGDWLNDTAVAYKVLYMLMLLICGNGTVWVKTHVPFPLHSRRQEVRGLGLLEATEEIITGFPWRVNKSALHVRCAGHSTDSVGWCFSYLCFLCFSFTSSPSPGCDWWTKWATAALRWSLRWAPLFFWIVLIFNILFMRHVVSYFNVTETWMVSEIQYSPCAQDVFLCLFTLFTRLRWFIRFTSAESFREEKFLNLLSLLFLFFLEFLGAITQEFT